MKKATLSAVVILLSTTGMVQARQNQQNKLGVTFNVTYLSSYIWRGADVYAEGHSAIQPSITLDLYGTGFGLKVLNSRANKSGYENNEEFDYTLFYSSNFLESETYVTNYTVGWVYYNYPDEPKEAANMQEVYLSLSWPKICSAGLVPSYTIVCAWPSKSNSTNASDWGGWVHVLGLGYDLNVPGLVSDTSQQILHLSAMAVYNDGIGPPGETVDHDWSHAVFGVSTNFDLGKNLTFTPGIYYQASMDDSVNTQDETWCSLGLSYKF